jgi:hypothetical protein
MDNNPVEQHPKHPMKQWGRQVKGENSWTMFKVISEFVRDSKPSINWGPAYPFLALPAPSPNIPITN